MSSQLTESSPKLTRQGMIETAKKHATATVKAAKPEASAEAETEEGAEEEAAEPKAEEVEVDEEGEEKEKEVGSGTEASVEMRRDRAQRILKALGAR